MRAHRLDLHMNRLSATVPSQLGKLTAMTNALYLDANALSGTVPPQLSTFPPVEAFLSGYFRPLALQKWKDTKGGPGPQTSPPASIEGICF